MINSDKWSEEIKKALFKPSKEPTIHSLLRQRNEILNTMDSLDDPNVEEFSRKLRILKEQLIYTEEQIKAKNRRK